MPIPSIESRLFHGPHRCYILIVIFSLYLAISTCFTDVLIDESDSAPSDAAREKWGIKMTNVTRPIAIACFLSIGTLAVWWMWQL
jgi:hypothetical protein